MLTETTSPPETAETDDTPDAPGVLITELATLPPQTILNITALKKILGVDRRTISNMVNRGELPPPLKMLGSRIWMAGRILKHIDERAESAAREAEAARRRKEGISR